MKRKNLVKNRENGKFSFILLFLFLFSRFFLPPFSLWIERIPIGVIILLNLGILLIEFSISKRVSPLRIALLLTLPTFLWGSVLVGLLETNNLPDTFYLSFFNGYYRLILCYYLTFLIGSFELNQLSKVHSRFLRFSWSYFLIKFLVSITFFFNNNLLDKYLFFITLCFFYTYSLYTGNLVVLYIVLFIVYVSSYCSFTVIYFNSTKTLNKKIYDRVIKKHFS